MELREIEYFLSIANSRSLSHAADELYVSQSALSQFLTKLEKNIGTPLFIRNNKQLTLTEAGEIYYIAAKKILEIKRDTIQDISQIANLNRYALRLGTTGVRSLRFATYLMPMMKEKYPLCQLQLINGESSTIYSQISNYSLDFALIAQNYHEDDYEIVRLHSEEIGICVPEGHPFLKKLSTQGIDPDTPIDVSLLESETVLISRKGSIFYQTCVDYFNQQGFQPKKILCSWESSAMALNTRLLETIGFASEGYARDEDGVVFQRMKDPPYFNLGIIYRKGYHLSEMQRYFISLAEEHRSHY